ncbi:hypothetical protein [Brachyspira pulli]|uniref:hypothetical protein n=1 Tax=Brachyspira pulli TaxID=310721 RepID=UPI0030072338
MWLIGLIVILFLIFVFGGIIKRISYNTSISVPRLILFGIVYIILGMLYYSSFSELSNFKKIVFGILILISPIFVELILNIFMAFMKWVRDGWDL